MQESLRTVATAVLCAIGCAGLLSCGTSTPRPRHNVLLITLDTTRADRLGCYGYALPTSPQLDALAAESAVFDLAIAQAAVTPVSHASILTGREPFNHGLRVLHGLVANRLDEGETTLAEVWRQTGAPTAAFVSAFPASSAFGLEQGFDVFDEDFPNADGAGLRSEKGTVNTGPGQRRADATTTAAERWLRGQAGADKPFLMWAHYFDPHDPQLLPPREFLQSPPNAVFKPPSADKADVLRSLYDIELRYMDSQIGRLLDTLRELDLWDDTIVVVVADHGEGLGDHGWWTHGVLYQEQIRVPLIVRIPGAPRGVRVADMVRTIDLMPTILEAAGVDPESWPAMDGLPLTEALRSGQLSEPRRAYAESVNMLNYIRPDGAGERDAKNDKHYCLIDGADKVIYHQLRPDESELFDLADDPVEQDNLADSHGAALDRLLQDLRAMDVFSPLMPGMTDTDLERADKLKSLGYVQ